MPHRIFLHVNAVNPYNALIHIVKSWDKLHERRLSRARLTDNSYRLPRLYVKRYVGENILCRLLLVLEAHMLELYLAALNTYIPCKLVRYVNLLVEHLHNSRTRREGARHHKKHV